MVLALILIGISSVMPEQAHAMPLLTSGGSVQVLLEAVWEEDNEATFRIIFYEPDSSKIQRHVDFDLAVIDRNGDRIFSAAEYYRQPVLHTNPGVAIISYRFPEISSYIVKVYIFGVNFVPSNTEFVELPVNITPEFSREITIFLAMATVMGITVIRDRLYRIWKKV